MATAVWSPALALNQGVPDFFINLYILKNISYHLFYTHSDWNVTLRRCNCQHDCLRCLHHYRNNALGLYIITIVLHFTSFIFT